MAYPHLLHVSRRVGRFAFFARLHRRFMHVLHPVVNWFILPPHPAHVLGSCSSPASLMSLTRYLLRHRSQSMLKSVYGVPHVLQHPRRLGALPMDTL